MIGAAGSGRRTGNIVSREQEGSHPFSVPFLLPFCVESFLRGDSVCFRVSVVRRCPSRRVPFSRVPFSPSVRLAVSAPRRVAPLCGPCILTRPSAAVGGEHPLTMAAWHGHGAFHSAAGEHGARSRSWWPGYALVLLSVILTCIALGGLRELAPSRCGPGHSRGGAPTPSNLEGRLSPSPRRQRTPWPQGCRPLPSAFSAGSAGRRGAALCTWAV